MSHCVTYMGAHNMQLHTIELRRIVARFTKRAEILIINIVIIVAVGFHKHSISWRGNST